jgi:uncharacterized membrane protein
MITDFISSPAGAYVLTFVLAVAVGLVAGTRGARAWLATVLITIVFAAWVYVGDATFAAPLYVVTSGVVAIIIRAFDLRDSPLLEGEPWWRNVLLVTAHGGTVQNAARAKERDEATVWSRG